MEGKLIKENDFYMLEVRHERIGDMIIASSDHDFSKIINHRFKLSTKNCQAIENGYDLDDKISKHLEKNDIEASAKRVQVIRELILEILGDKKFSEEDMKNAIYIAWDDDNLASTDIIQSLQQTEWNVEIVMECVIGCENLIINGENSLCCGNKKPKLDTDGCLILKIK